jgi:hypothetical protein
VRRAVLEAAARSRTPGLDALCRAAAGRSADPDAEALAFLGVLGSPQDLRILLDSLDVPELHLGALRGLGALGDVAAVPKLLDWIESAKDSAGEAASAFARITGAGNLEAERPPAEEPGARSVAEEFEVETPTPDPAKARAVWSARQRAFAPGRRWQAGIDVTASAQDVARRPDLQLALRRDLYLSLRARRGGSVRDVELEARARAQT